MVNEKEIVSFLKKKIQEHITYTGKPFRANSIIGCFNRDKKKREWFQQHYVAESQYLHIIHKHRRDFIYDRRTGNITVNKNPCVKPDYFDEISTGALVTIKENADKVVLLVKILDYLKEDSGEVHATENRNMCRGEVGVKLDDILEAVKPYAVEAFKASDVDLRVKMKSFCVRDNKSFIQCHSRTEVVTLNAFEDKRKFKEGFVDEAMEYIQELAKDMVVSALKEILKMDLSSSGKWKSFEELGNYLNKHLLKLAPIACEYATFEEENLKSIVEEEGGSDILIDEEKDMIALKSRVTNETQQSNEVLLYENRGETLREVKGTVDRVEQMDEISAVFITGNVDNMDVKFEGDLMSGEHAAFDVSAGDEVTFNARYNKYEKKWEAIKIIAVDRPENADSF